MADQVHLVIGRCGENSDRQEWIVCSYPKPEDAQGHADAATKAAAELREKWEEAMWGDADADPEQFSPKHNPYDPSEIVTGYTITYSTKAVELRSRFKP